MTSSAAVICLIAERTSRWQHDQSHANARPATIETDTLQAAFVLTKDNADGTDRRYRWFQLRFFIIGNKIIISNQFVSPVCSSVMNFPIVTPLPLCCDSMITEIAQIGDVRKYPAEKYSQQGIFVSLRPLCANFELLRYQRCSLDTFFFFGLTECDICRAG